MNFFLVWKEKEFKRDVSWNNICAFIKHRQFNNNKKLFVSYTDQVRKMFLILAATTLQNVGLIVVDRNICAPAK